MTTSEAKYLKALFAVLTIGLFVMAVAAPVTIEAGSLTTKSALAKKGADDGPDDGASGADGGGDDGTKDQGSGDIAKNGADDGPDDGDSGSDGGGDDGTEDQGRTA